jgi:hypothetical protein
MKAKLITMVLCVSSTLALAQKSTDSRPAITNKSNQSVTYSVIAAANNTWGYDIFVNGKLTIHQPNIPGQSGQQGFSSKETAEEIAKIIVGKIKNGEMLPAITSQDLQRTKADSLKKQQP